MSKERKTDLIESVKNKGKSIEGEMSFFDHLAELRIHLVRSAIAIVITTIFCFVYYDFIFDTIIMGPHKPTFWTHNNGVENEIIVNKTKYGSNYYCDSRANKVYS